jgi:hypothetical protein
MLRLAALRSALVLLTLLVPLGAPGRSASAQQPADAPPETLSLLSFGGSRHDTVVDVALDATGNIYLLGATGSPDFPTLNAAQPRFGGGPAGGGESPVDAFVVSLAPDGRTMRYSTFLGGSGQDRPAAIAVTPDGLAYVAGVTESTDLPLAGSGFLGAALRGRDDGFLAALGQDGALLASGYFGGAERDQIQALALTPDGGVALAGFTDSPDFPTVAALQATPGGKGDAFVAVAEPGLARLRFSTYLGGDDYDAGGAVLAGPDGVLYVGGSTESRNFPVHDALQPALPEDKRSASFLAGLAPDGASLQFSTYLGGVRTAETVSHLAIAANGDLLVGVNVYQTGYVVRLSAGASAVAYSTNRGPPDGVAFDAEGHSFVAITPYPHKSGFVLPPGAEVPCELGLPEIVELDAQGAVAAVMISPVSFGAFALASDGRMVIAGLDGSAERWPPRAAGNDDYDAQVAVVRAGHGRMAWLWPPPFANAGPPEFFRLWARTDGPGAGGRLASGTAWRWGPQPISGRLCESTEADGGAYRYVQYFDKGRMELNYPERAPYFPFVSGGRLAVELISGQLQLGPTDVEQRQPSDEAVVGDPAAGNPQAPTYRAFGAVAWPQNRQRAEPSRGTLVTQRLDAGGIVTNDPALGRYSVRLGPYNRQLGHNIAAVFTAWALRAETVPLGLPLSEPYWVRARVGGQERELLVQPFERGILSYTPDNPPGWRVELGNIGRHYVDWRYGQR